MCLHTYYTLLVFKIKKIVKSSNTNSNCILCVRVCAHVLRIVSADRILHFMNIIIMVTVYCIKMINLHCHVYVTV